MTYRIDNIDIGDYGAIPIVQGEDLPLTGTFSLPARKGDTERDWGTGIEAFTEADEIILEGRTLTLNVAIRGNSRPEYAARITAFKRTCLNARLLSTGYADFAVLMKDEVKITEYQPHLCAVAVVPFWQQVVVVPPLTIPKAVGKGWQLDECALFEGFGIIVSKQSGDQHIGKRIEVNTTAPYPFNEYRDPSIIVLECGMRGVDYADLYRRMGQFQALCIAPGQRWLTSPEGVKHKGYIKEGFAAKARHKTLLTFSLKFRVI